MPKSKSVFCKKELTSWSTTLQLEPEYWQALESICRREQSSIQEICTAVFHTSRSGLSMDTAMQLFIFDYFYQASTDEGHVAAGHMQENVFEITQTSVH